MNGVNGDDLVIALYLSPRTDAPWRTLLNTRRTAGDWSQVVGRHGIHSSALAPEVKTALSKDNRTLGLAAARAMIAEYYGWDPAILRKLLETGAEIRDLHLAVLLSRARGMRADQVLRSVVGREKSWGEIITGAGLDPGALDGLVRAREKKDAN